jgi:hypothetical protein
MPTHLSTPSRIDVEEEVVDVGKSTKIATPKGCLAASTDLISTSSGEYAALKDHCSASRSSISTSIGYISTHR